MHSVALWVKEADLFDSKGNRKYLNTRERAAFLRVINQEANLKRRVFCLVLFYTGCRLSEGLNLTPERVDLSGEAVVFETLKRRERGIYRAVPIPNNLINQMRRVLDNVEPSSRIWKCSRTTAYRWIKAKMQQIQIEESRACPKGLRHSFAVTCIAAGIPLTTIRKWLGHARLETTAIYLEVSGDEERELAQRLWPKERKAGHQTCQNRDSK